MDKGELHLSEGDVEKEIWRYFEDLKHKDKQITAIRSQYPAGTGTADLVVFGKDSKPLIVIEVKKVIDPYELDVVEQASRYANSIGS